MNNRIAEARGMETLTSSRDSYTHSKPMNL